MIRRVSGLFLACAIAAAAAAEEPAGAAGQPGQPAGSTGTPAPARQRFYVPPAPGKRVEGGLVGAGTRSARAPRCAARLTVLAPEDHVGLTVQAQPTLYFFLSQDTPCSVQFVLNDRRQVPPLVEASLLEAGRQGFHAIRLADHGITLEPGIEYDWFVQVTDDPSRRTPQNFSGAQVRRVEAPPQLGSELGQGGAVRSQVLGAHSLWYDAVAARLEEDGAGRASGASSPQDPAILEEIGVAVP